MKLPNREIAFVPGPKLAAYLSSETHPVGRAKALLMRDLGYDDTNVDLLEQDLIAVAHEQPVAEVIVLEYGVKYVIDGVLQATAVCDCLSGVRVLLRERPMVRELDTVILTRDIAGHALKRGDVGVVVHCYPDEKAFELEFVTGEGTTVGLLTLTGLDFRLMGQGDILHARKITPG